MSSGFVVGDRVRVRPAFPPGHVRAPFFTRGKRGEIVSILGHYAMPEALAYGRDGLPERALYRVRFAMDELWEEPENPRDQVVVDIYEHWLEPCRG
ncbi:MAG: SH3-like domain-containing protein [Geminicoccaceae bacterium]